MSSSSTAQHANQHAHIPRRLPTAGPMMAFERSLHSVPPLQPAKRSPLRLTRRGRVVVLLTLLTLLTVAFVLGRAGSSEASTSAPGPQQPYAQTTVHQGETLWAVARRVAPGQDPRGVVLKIRELNKLDTAAVAVGQQLILPR